MSTKNFYGIYPATVVDNQDSDNRGRLQLQIPGVTGLAPSSWAEPCVPLAGSTGPAMGAYLVPPIGAGVWVQFVDGDPERPIWMGCRWGDSSTVPDAAKPTSTGAPPIVLQTLGQNCFIMSDAPGTDGGFTFKTSGGAKITINDTGITLSIGSSEIKMTTDKITLNNGALEVQ
jgi:uncharacterized protein involved in type VI secretion and phage assembly